MNSIELKNVTKRLKGNTVLDDITFTFESGNIYGLYGRNASGKTALVRCQGFRLSFWTCLSIAMIFLSFMCMRRVVLVIPLSDYELS